MPKKYPLCLEPAQREQLEKLLTSGTAASRSLTHARILLKADQGDHGPAWKNAAIAEAFEVSELTVTRVRKRFTEEGLERALYHKPQARRKAPRLDGAAEAHLLALVCSEPPAGRARWPLRLLAEKMVELGHAEALSHETVRQALKKGISNRG
jgi:transposase